VATLTLSIDEVVPGRAFTDPHHLAGDTAVLEDVRRALRARMGEIGAGGEWHDGSGDEHLLVVPDTASLLATRPVVAIGFFGQARDDVDHAPIVELERSVLERASEFRGLLAYHNVRFAAAHQCGNLVVFTDHDAPAELAGDDEHRRSIGRTPRHYHSLRLHRYELPAGALGAGPLRWVRTTYLDFSDDPPWRAVRSYDGSSVAGKPGARRSTPTASSSRRTTIGDQAEPP